VYLVAASQKLPNGMAEPLGTGNAGRDLATRAGRRRGAPELDVIAGQADDSKTTSRVASGQVPPPTRTPTPAAVAAGHRSGSTEVLRRSLQRSTRPRRRPCGSSAEGSSPPPAAASARPAGSMPVKVSSSHPSRRPAALGK
jgi:hypothetical protein